MIRWIESAGIVLFLFLVVRSYGQLFQGDALLSAGAAVLAWPFGFYLADLVTGVIHWLCDSFGSVDTPIWGPYFVSPFRRHHQYMTEITQFSLAENLGNSSFVGIIALLVFPIDVDQTSSFTSVWAGHLWVFAVFFAVMANLFHRWAHLPRGRQGKLIRFLQQKRILLSSEEHLGHHVKPYRKNYCVLCGWANPLVNRIPLTKIEALLERWGLTPSQE